MAAPWAHPMSLQGNRGAEPSHLSASPPSPPPPRVPTRGVAVSPRQRLPRSAARQAAAARCQAMPALRGQRSPSAQPGGGGHGPAWLRPACPPCAHRLALAARVSATPRCPGEGSWGKGREPGFTGSPRALRVRLAARGRCCGSFPCGGHGLWALRGSCPILLRPACCAEVRRGVPGLSLRLHGAGGRFPARGTKRIRHLLARGEAKLGGPPITTRLVLPNASRNGGTHELDHESSSALPLPAFPFPGGDPFFPLGFAVRGRGAGEDPSGGAARR